MTSELIYSKKPPHIITYSHIFPIPNIPNVRLLTPTLPLAIPYMLLHIIYTVLTLYIG